MIRNYKCNTYGCICPSHVTQQRGELPVGAASLALTHSAQERGSVKRIRLLELPQLLPLRSQPLPLSRRQTGQ